MRYVQQIPKWDDECVETFPTIFSSGGQEIRLQVQRPENHEGSPAILLYHGSCGIDPRDHCIRDLARTAAAHGFTALIVHYFDRTKTNFANMRTVLRHSERWIVAVRDALTFALDQFAIDPECIATLGRSLGGFLAVAHAARDERVRANVVICGGIDPFTLLRVRRLPPTLVIHGENDRRVPKEKAYQLCNTLSRLGAPFTTRF